VIAVLEGEFLLKNLYCLGYETIDTPLDTRPGSTQIFGAGASLFYRIRQ